ncbi:MAG: ATP-binding protein, partial [Bacteroidota bacterium]
NYTVYCSTGKETIDDYKGKKIDFILCDIHMDGKSGFDLLEEIRVNNRMSMIPFVLMSGMMDPFVIRRAMWLGADDVLEKPFSINDLINVFNAQAERIARIHKYAEERLDTLRSSIQKVFPSELYNSLHIISGNSYILTELTEEIDQRKLKRIGNSITKGANQLHTIFDNISLYTHLLTNKDVFAKLSKESFAYDAGMVIENVCRNTAKKYEREHCLKMQNNFSTQVRIAREYLEKVITIVVDNAFKFSQIDSIVYVDVKEDSSLLKITVVDNGDGLNEDQLSQIGPFMQFDKNTYQQRGIGLGISLAKLIVELHSGIISFTSQKGQGTTVSIILPILPK